MYKKIKKWRPFQMGMLAFSAGLVFFAEVSASSACALSWYEPDCPDELIR